jgi:hypothetical protein
VLWDHCCHHGQLGAEGAIQSVTWLIHWTCCSWVDLSLVADKQVHLQVIFISNSFTYLPLKQSFSQRGWLGTGKCMSVSLLGIPRSFDLIHLCLGNWYLSLNFRMTCSVSVRTTTGVTAKCECWGCKSWCWWLPMLCPFHRMRGMVWQCRVWVEHSQCDSIRKTFE